MENLNLSLYEQFRNATIAELLEYVGIAGAFYLVFYVLLKNKLKNRKIQQALPKKASIWHEVKYSISTILIFSATNLIVVKLIQLGYTRFYTDIDEYGIVYLGFSVIAMILIHDTYFYWAHRFMHLKKVYPIVHLVHHKSTNPTPWAAYSFHPIEAFLHALSFPVIIFLIPSHPIAVLLWFTYSFLLNVGGHLGYEVFPSGFTKNKLFGLANTSTHHNMHHKHFDCNYGIYFNVWDQLMRTNHKDYHKTFEKLAQTDLNATKKGETN